jgi:hypothetical protein
VKNSLRAVQDRFDDGEEEPPPIRLVVAEGGEDVTIKVGVGGGARKQERGVAKERPAGALPHVPAGPGAPLPVPPTPPAPLHTHLTGQRRGRRHPALGAAPHLVLPLLHRQEPGAAGRQRGGERRAQRARGLRLRPAHQVGGRAAWGRGGEHARARLGASPPPPAANQPPTLAPRTPHPPVFLPPIAAPQSRSRLYARYFGGDLQIISMEGYGTDAYLHLNRLGNVQEPLP